MRLEGFSPREAEMVGTALAAPGSAGYDVGRFCVLIRAELPRDYRGMSWPDGAVLGAEVFTSQAMLNHMLEEEFLHLLQKSRGLFDVIARGTAGALEGEANAERQFHLPKR